MAFSRTTLEKLEGHLIEKYPSKKTSMVIFEEYLDKSTDANVQAVKTLVGNLQCSVLYITFNKRATDLIEKFRVQNVDLKKMSFLDTVSVMYGIKPKANDGCVYISSPFQIDDVQSKISELLYSIKSEKKIVLIDSITGVLLYNSLESASKFIKNMIENLRNNSVSGVFITNGKGTTNEKLIAEIDSLVDHRFIIEEK
jgi:hypothetical protein